MSQGSEKEAFDLQETFFNLTLEQMDGDGETNEVLADCTVKSASRMMAIVRTLNAEGRRSNLRVYKVVSKPSEYYLKYAYGPWGEENAKPSYILTVVKERLPEVKSN